jgi:multicomponent Na+:H+ antiporter subunit D
VTVLPWVVVLPLAGGGAALVAGQRWAGAVAATTAATIALAVGLLAVEVRTAGAIRHEIGGWRAPLGIALSADGTGVALMLATVAVMMATAVHASRYLETAGDERWNPRAAFWPVALLLWAALNGIFTAGDLFNAYVALEMLTVAGVALVALEGDRVALAAALRYLLAAFLGSLSYLLGVGLLYAQLGALDLATLAVLAADSGTSAIALSLVIGGLLLKTALFPLHFWLPRAHASAPAPVSAMLSALVVTASFHLALRSWVALAPAATAWHGAQVIAGMGALAIVWGSVEAIRQRHLKLLVAYSTVAHVGYLFVVFALVAPPSGSAPGVVASWAADAWSGGIYHAVSHALAKGAMFLAAGAIMKALGHDRITGVRGIANHLPVSTYAFGIGGVTLIGLPPSGGFVAKWLMLGAALESGQWWWAVVILLGGVLTAGYVFMVIGQTMSRAASDVQPEFAAVPARLEYAALALALLSLLAGLHAVEPIALILSGRPFASSGILP